MALSREFVAENSEKTLETPLDKQGSFREGDTILVWQSAKSRWPPSFLRPEDATNHAFQAVEEGSAPQGPACSIVRTQFAKFLLGQGAVYKRRPVRDHRQ